MLKLLSVLPFLTQDVLSFSDPSSSEESSSVGVKKSSPIKRLLTNNSLYKQKCLIELLTH